MLSLQICNGKKQRYKIITEMKEDAGIVFRCQEEADANIKRQERTSKSNNTKLLDIRMSTL